MTGLMKRIFRRREPGKQPRRSVASLFRGRARGQRLPGYKRLAPFKLPGRLKRWPWSRAPAPATDRTQETQQVVLEPPPSFKDRGRLRRRLRFLRRARELGFRDIGGLVFDMRRFEHDRPDLLDAKIDALLAVDRELRTLERVLDDRRAFHELREPGISSCARCGALHSSEANFCPQCGLQLSGPRAMGEVGGAIAAPPQPPHAAGAEQPPATPAPQEWPWPAAQPDQPTTTLPSADPVTDQLTVPYVPVLGPDQPQAQKASAPETTAETPAGEDAPPPRPATEKPAAAATKKPAPKKPATRKQAAGKPGTRKSAANRSAAAKPAAQPADPAKPSEPNEDDHPADGQQTETRLPPQTSGGS